MKSIIVNAQGTIINGKLKGIYGNVVLVNATSDEVEIQVDKNTIITTNSDNVRQ